MFRFFCVHELKLFRNSDKEKNIVTKKHQKATDLQYLQYQYLNIIKYLV